MKSKDAINRENILKAGGTINTLTPAQRTEWVEAMKPVWGSFEEKIGKALIETAANS